MTIKEFLERRCAIMQYDLNNLKALLSMPESEYERGLARINLDVYKEWQWYKEHTTAPIHPGFRGESIVKMIKEDDQP